MLDCISDRSATLLCSFSLSLPCLLFGLLFSFMFVLYCPSFADLSAIRFACLLDCLFSVLLVALFRVLLRYLALLLGLLTLGFCLCRPFRSLVCFRFRRLIRRLALFRRLVPLLGCFL